ncbi:ferredoxin--NADP reductase [Chromatiaceae bacterium AAb-1]|nr:ferredoxin--NADP reductase [Chromatiaceae bacterium AAb-1]
MAQWLNGTVISNHRWHDRLFSLRVSTGPFPFIAGQFVRLALETPEGRIQRAYSLVNSPGSHEQEFLVSTVAEGLLSPRLQQLQPGDTLHVSHPATGFFILDEIPAGNTLWLISSGTGIGPFLSILGTAAPWQRFAKIILLHSVRTGADLVYQPLIQQWQQQYPAQFHYQPVVTRERVNGALSNRIPQLIEDGTLEQACGQQLNKDSQVMMCGNPQMIVQTRAVLESKGLKKHLRRDPGQITVEQYWK